MDYAYASFGPTLQVVALVFLLAFALALLGLAIFLAALPGRLAVRRGHRQASSVNLLGWLGLPTGVLWVAAMAWAVWREADDAPQASLDQELSRLEGAVRDLEEAVGQGR